MSGQTTQLHGINTIKWPSWHSFEKSLKCVKRSSPSAEEERKNDEHWSWEMHLSHPIHTQEPWPKQEHLNPEVSHAQWRRPRRILIYPRWSSAMATGVSASDIRFSMMPSFKTGKMEDRVGIKIADPLPNLRWIGIRKTERVPILPRQLKLRQRIKAWTPPNGFQNIEYPCIWF